MKYSLVRYDNGTLWVTDGYYMSAFTTVAFLQLDINRLYREFPNALTPSRVVETLCTFDSYEDCFSRYPELFI